MPWASAAAPRRSMSTGRSCGDSSSRSAGSEAASTTHCTLTDRGREALRRELDEIDAWLDEVERELSS